jgi:hypothetical protein
MKHIKEKIMTFQSTCIDGFTNLDIRIALVDNAHFDLAQIHSSFKTFR